MKEALKHKSILLFDGVCNLCNSSVQFVLKHEKKHKQLFASLQSDIGKEILSQYEIDVTKTDSLVLVENNRAYIKSSAALRLSRKLKGLYPVLYVFIIIPPFIRNAIYDYVARNRYKWFGKTDTCMIPDKNSANRFL